MVPVSLGFRWRPAAAQGGVAAAALMLVAAAPPAHGRTLLLPLAGQTRGALYALAVARGALPLAAGPGPASLVVMTAKDDMPADLLAAGILPLAAPFVLCGDAGR